MIKTDSNDAQSVIVALSIAIPVFGGVLSSAMSAHLNEKRFKNIEEILESLSLHLGQHPSSVSDDYIQFCIEALQVAQHEHRSAKRRDYGRLLARAVSGSSFDYDRSKHYLDLLMSMHPLHLSVLMKLKDVRAQNLDDPWVKFRTLLESTENVQKEILSSALQRLASFGVISSKGSPKIMTGTNPVGLWYCCSYSITETGRAFLENLEEPG